VTEQSLVSNITVKIVAHASLPRIVISFISCIFRFWPSRGFRGHSRSLSDTSKR